MRLSEPRIAPLSAEELSAAQAEVIAPTLAKELLQAIKARAAAEGISYQKFIRMTLEQTVARSSKE